MLLRFVPAKKEPLRWLMLSRALGEVSYEPSANHGDVLNEVSHEFSTYPRNKLRGLKNIIHATKAFAQ